MTLIGADEALDFAKLIYPARWIEERGCVIRGDVFERDNFEEWWTATEGDASGVEAVINHLHLWDVLPNADEKDYAELWALGELMVRAWRSSLSEQFPDRRFEVRLTNDCGPTVTAYSAREAATP